MTRFQQTVLLFWLVGLALAAGCGEKQGFRKETFPVTGTVLVDGQPASLVQVSLHDVKGMDKQHPTLSSGFTGDDGKFSLTTYEFGDGVPEGEYKVTFMLGQLNMVSMQYGGPDKLNARYSDPEKTEFRVKVEKGKPADMGKIELTTK
jgi:hypothetical protein